MTQRLLWPVTRLGVVFDEYERAALQPPFLG